MFPSSDEMEEGNFILSTWKTGNKFSLTLGLNGMGKILKNLFTNMKFIKPDHTGCCLFICFILSSKQIKCSGSRLCKFHLAKVSVTRYPLRGDAFL